jgi:hypothetical protein
MKLHFLEKKYGIRINLLDWSGDDYETGTLNSLIKIDRSDVGRILLESIAYHVKHNPGNLAQGILEIRPYAQGDCNGSTDPDLTTNARSSCTSVVAVSRYALPIEPGQYQEATTSVTGLASLICTMIENNDHGNRIILFLNDERVVNH